MAPTKSTRAVSKQSVATSTLTTLMPLARKGLTRRTASNVQDQNIDIMQTRAKRKAEHSPQKNDKIKRSALGNLTNNVNNNKMTLLHSEEDAKQQQMMKKKELVQNLFGQQNAAAVQLLKETQNLILQQSSVQGAQQQQHQKPSAPLATKVATRASTRNHKDAGNNITSKAPLEDQTNKLLTNCQATKSKAKDEPPAAPLPPQQHHQVQKVANKPVRRISNEFNKTEESLYMSALEDISGCDSMRLSANFEAAKRRSVALQQQNKTDDSKLEDEKALETEEKLPEGVEDIDKANWNDLFLVSHYARDIFNYLKQRECEFPIDDYMERQVHISKWMRSLLVDWMVEVQETFELNHETLYLAVKIVDLFLCKELINKDKLQLLGAAALFIACKFDERTPPLVEDFLYICDGAYKHDELIEMEITTLKTIGFDLGIPLSYRFLRRYARCAKTQMPTLTLARYILELSLMDYDCITLSDSKMACAALFMALRLHGEEKPWSPTLIHYTGYQLQDFAEIVPILNAGLHRKPKGTIKTIRSKYSHKIFHEVAKVPLMTTEQLFANNLDFDLSTITTPEQQKLLKQQQQIGNSNSSSGDKKT
ncbi:cyclin B3 [Cochliomyia hominivorax]